MATFDASLTKIDMDELVRDITHKACETQNNIQDEWLKSNFKRKKKIAFPENPTPEDFLEFHINVKARFNSLQILELTYRGKLCSVLAISFDNGEIRYKIEDIVCGGD